MLYIVTNNKYTLNINASKAHFPLIVSWVKSFGNLLSLALILCHLVLKIVLEVNTLQSSKHFSIFKRIAPVNKFSSYKSFYIAVIFF